MIRLDLNAEERTILIDILESYLSDLRMEIANTDQLDYRELLREKKGVIERTLSTLRAPAEAVRQS